MCENLDDRQLLQRYAQSGDPQAFAQLVQRHTDLVYSVAVRQLRDAHLAQDVMQEVFMLLARKASSIPTRSLLTGWLFWAARLQSYRTLRGARRRQRHELRSADMASSRTAAVEPDPWTQIEPLLNRALARLGNVDRDAVLLRFFQSKTHGQIGLALGLSEEAAKKRVARAVEKLRALLKSQGVEIPAAGLSGSLASFAVCHAPAHLAAQLSATALSSASSCSSIGAFLKLGRIYMVMNRAAVFIVAAATTLLIGGAVLHVAAAPPPVAGTPSTSTPPAASAAASSVPTPAQSLQPAQMQRVYESLYLLRHPERKSGGDLFDRGELMDEWCDAIRQLAEIGKPAVPYLVAELDHTQSSFCLRNVAFTLRAIGDPRAVPALLRAMPRCAFPINDMGVPVNPQLAEFMIKNSVEGTAPQIPNQASEASLFKGRSSAFYYHRPIVEIDAALKKLTGHSEGDAHMRANPFGKTAAQKQAVRDLYSATAARWQKWWDQNHPKSISDQELATVQLPPTEGDPVETVGQAKFGAWVQKRIDISPEGRMQSLFNALSVAVDQQDAKAASDAVTDALKDYQTLAQQATDRHAKGDPIAAAGEGWAVTTLPEKRVALLGDLQKAVQAGDWPKAESLGTKLSQMGPGIWSFTQGPPPATVPVVAPVTTPPPTPTSP